MASAGDVTGGGRKGEEMNPGNPSPGELVLKKLFAQFVVCSQSKLNYVMAQPLANPLSKYLQRGEDPNFDQLLVSLKEVASFCLRSLLTVLNDWRKRQMKLIKTSPRWSITQPGDSTDSSQTLSKKEREYYTERQELAVQFIYCMTLTEILQQLPVHPVPESFIHDIETLAFHHFRAQEPLKERSTNNPNVANAKRIADYYAEVLGVVSQVRFLSVRMRFFSELRNPQNSSSVIISVIEGLSFVRVKMYPVEELEEWFSFLQECANYMMESAKGEKVRHAMGALLVDILTPVAAVIKYETSMPAVKKLVQTLYSHFYDQTKRARHSTAYIPLITILLAISEDKFFLNNWHVFVTQHVLPNLKRNDTKLQRVALDSLYRLLWVYMIRIKGEGNVITFNRLRPIVDTLFPRSGGKGVQLKDFPPNIFVKIIYFIARERVDYAVCDIVLELVTKFRGGLNPERVIIGLRAFLMIADSLEKKERDPPMPPAFSTMQSGSITRTKTKFLTSTLTDKIAKKIGIAQYYPFVRQALSGILKQLDQSVGNLISTNSTAIRAPDEALGGERKPKLDLLKTCVAAIPRIMPEGMSRNDMIELLSRLTIHLDNDLPRMAVSALQNIVSNYPDWRTAIVRGFANFILREVPDSCPLVLEGALKTLGQLLGHWRGLVTGGGQEELDLSDPPEDGIVWVESCALVTFCSYRSLTRKYSLAILKEVRSLLETFRTNKEEKRYQTVMDVMEKATPSIIKYYLGTLSQKERLELRTHQHLNLWWLSDRSACFLENGGGRETLRDAWSQCIVGLLEPSMLPSHCPLAVQLTWPYIIQRMLKAYYVVDPGSASERPDRLPVLRNPRGGYVSQPEMFLWRNYLFFACCTAPPSTSSPSVNPALQEAGRVLGDKYTAKDMFRIITPLIKSEEEIGEVVISALGLANPAAFRDLIQVLKPWITDSLDLRRSDTVKKRRRRETHRVHITRIIGVAAENGCFRFGRGALTEAGELSKPILEFIEGIKQCLETDAERLSTIPSDLRLHFASLNANIINSFPEGPSRLKLYPREIRYSLFYLIAGWSGPFWHQHTSDIQEQEQSLVKQPPSNALIYNVLQAMSALLCCGPVFEAEALQRGRYIYRWLENMLCSEEEKIQQLGRKTVQLLLQNNRESFLLNWVLDQCYSHRSVCAGLCFHALSVTFAKNPAYPCKMISILHVILYNTASLDHRTRERAMQLLHILDKRFFASGEEGSRRPEILGLITGSIYSNVHVPVSEELAFTNPELTLPLFSEMIKRFEETPSHGRKNILQLMKPWLRNVELVEENTRVQLTPSHVQDNVLPLVPAKPNSNPVLSGNGWGSLEGTHLILHNLLYLTAKHGDEFVPEIESLWSALCTWPTNIRIALNYLARLTCVAGNMTLMLQQAKRVVVYFSHTHAKIIIPELMKELQCVDLITAEVSPNETPPYYRLISRSQETHIGKEDNELSGRVNEEENWALRWRIDVRTKDGLPLPLPIPMSMKFFASMKDVLRIPCRQLINMHRSNFALILLSELVAEISDFDWNTQLPILLHVVTLGLDVHRPVVYEHSKKLLGNLTILLACRDEYAAACEARLAQYDMFLHSSSMLSLGMGEESELQKFGSIGKRDDPTGQNNLIQRVHTLIRLVSVRECRRGPWPFHEHNVRNLGDPFSKVSDLSSLVNQILSVFQNCVSGTLKEKWVKTALSWATSCSSQQFASQSFQICRALQIPLSTSMLREILTRLAESASNQSDELQNYLLEILLTLESSIDSTDEDTLNPSQLHPEHPRQNSDITPLLSKDDHTSESTPKKMEHSLTSETSSPTVTIISARPPLPTSRQRVSTPVINTKEKPPVSVEPTVPFPTALGHRRNHSRGHSITKVDIPLDLQSSLNSKHEGTSFRRSTQLKDAVVPTTEGLNEEIYKRLQTAGGKMKFSASVDMEGLPPTKSQTEPPVNVRVVASTNEPVSKRDSAPPISLMNLFEPLPSSKVTMETQLQRPMSMIVSSSNGLHNNSLFTTPSIVTSFTLSDLSAITSSSSPPRQGSTSPGILIRTEALDEEEEDELEEEEEEDEEDEETEIEEQFPKQSSLDKPSTISRGPDNIKWVPSHPNLSLNPFIKSDSLDSSPIIRARSVTQLQSEIYSEEKPVKRRSYSGSREAVPGFTGLTKDNSHMRRSLDKLREKVTAPHCLPLSHQNSPNKVEKERLGRRISADPERERVHSAPGSRGKGRPKSMIETSSIMGSIDVGLATSQDYLSQLFWTSVSLLESDHENEYSLAQHLFGKVITHLDWWVESTYTRLEALLNKMRWEKFPGVLHLLLKGLTLHSTTDTTRQLISRLCPHANRPIFEPSGFVGLPMSIVALLPELILHYEKPTSICKTTAETISQACSLALPNAHNNELVSVLKDLSHLFHLYSIEEFTNSCFIWLKSVCHFICKGYSNLTKDILKFFCKLLEQGSETYHQSVLWIIHQYLINLEECGVIDMDIVSEIVTSSVLQLIKGHLWQDALEVLMLTIKNSSKLVQPPTSHIPVVDLGIFHQTLPGPTLQFSMDLSDTSDDVRLAQDTNPTSTWRQTSASQRQMRERLLNVINASGPVPVLFSSPSVIFTDEQYLNSYFESSEEEEMEDEVEEEEEEENNQIPSAKASSEVLDSSQPESVVINSIGETFDFLNNYDQYSDEEEVEEEEMTIEGPFSSGREKTYTSSLTSSRSSLLSEDEDQNLAGDIPEFEGETSQVYLSHLRNFHENNERSVSPILSLEHSTERSLSPVLPSNSLIRSISPLLPSSSLEQSSSPPKRSSPSPLTVQFSLEESVETTSTDQLITSIEMEEKHLSIDQDEMLEEEEEEEEDVKVRLEEIEPVDLNRDNELPSEGSCDLPEITDAMESEEQVLETIVDIEVTTTVINHTGALDSDVVTIDTISVSKSDEEAKYTVESITEPGVQDIDRISDEEVIIKERSIVELSVENEGNMEERTKEPFVLVDVTAVNKEMEKEDEKEPQENEEIEEQEVTEIDEEKKKGMNILDEVITSDEQTKETEVDEEEKEKETKILDEVVIPDEQTEEIGVDEEEKKEMKIVDEVVIAEEQVKEIMSEEIIKDVVEENMNVINDVLECSDKSDSSVEQTQDTIKMELERDSPLLQDRDDDIDGDYEDEIPEKGEEVLFLSSSDEEDESEELKQHPRVDVHRVTHFISIPDEEVEEMWIQHVTNLSRSKSSSLAVNTFYLYNRLFSVYKQLTCTLTEKSCNIMGERFWNISTHFIVTIELMVSQLDIPRVYLDTELVSKAGILDQLVILALEIQKHSEHFSTKRKCVIENLSHCKQNLLTQSTSSLDEKSLKLCHSVHQLHFHLLLFISSYIKLLTLLKDALTQSEVIDISKQLTETKDQVQKGIIQYSRGPHEMLDHDTELLVKSMNGDEAIRYLLECITDQQPTRALLVLHCMRSHFRDEQLFGLGKEDDADIIIFAYAHFLAKGQHGVIGVTSVEPDLVESHSHLMSQNISLSSLLNEQSKDDSNLNDVSALSSES